MQSPVPPASPRSSGQVVLVVEDNDVYRAVVKASLGQYLPGTQIWEAASVKEGLTILRSRSVDVVVVDMTLPDGTALTLIESAAPLIQAGLKAIVFSNLASEDMLPLVDRRDVYAYVEKSQGPRQLAQVIQTAISDHSQVPPPSPN